MSKEQRDGLFMDNSVLMADEKKPGFPIMSRVIQFLVILVGSWSSVSILLSSLPVQAKLFEINMAILICAGVMFALCLIPYYDAVKIFFGILFYALFFYSRFPRLQNGFYILENAAIDRLVSYYNFQSSYFIADYSIETADTTLLIIMIIIPMVTLFAVAIIRGRFTNLTSIILFLPVTISFLFGLIPSEKYLIVYIACILYLTRSGFPSHHAVNEKQKVLIHRINSRAAVWLSLISVILFFILKLFVSEEKYDNISEIKDMKSDIQNTLFNYTLEDLTHGLANVNLPSFNPPSGGLSGGELGKTGTVKYTESEQLRITAPFQSIAAGFYLKGYVGSVYSGDRWDGHDNEEDTAYKDLLKDMPEEEFAPVNQAVYFINICGRLGLLKKPEPGVMTIEYEDANRKYLYAPYYTDFDAVDNIEYKQDLYAAPDKKKGSYTIAFYEVQGMIGTDFTRQLISGNLQTPTLQLGDYSKHERQYRRFVYQAYTQLPGNGLEQLKQQCAQVLKENPDYKTGDKIAYIMNYLDSNTSYTLSPGKLPKGKDFVEYFLYENKKGYCAHYASAAALMLRALGVPARYAEGYAVSPGDITKNLISGNSGEAASDQHMDSDSMLEISVKDYNAHAWVEVYMDNFGWIPVDFTPSSFNDYSDIGQDENSNSATPTPVPSQPSPTPVINKPQTDDTKPDSAASPDASAPNKELVKQQHKFDALFLTIFAALAAGLIALGLTVFFYRRRKSRREVNSNKRTIFLFARIEKILTYARGLGSKGARLEDCEEYVKEHCSYIDAQTFASFMETARKARYGRDKITREELLQAQDFHNSLYARVNNELNFVKRIFFRIFLFV